MTTRLRALSWLFLGATSVALLHCSAADEPESTASGMGGATGGAAVGGAKATPGGATSGGVSTGGPPATGGSTSGGTATGGATGGALTGGAASGGTASGGTASGGATGGSASDGATGGSASDGAATGGSGGATGGSASTGGTASPGGSGSGGGASSPGDRTIPTAIPTPSNGNGEIRDGTTLLKSGKNGGKDVWDFENQKIGVNNSSDCDDGEDQLTVFEVEDGVTVKNLIIAGGLPGGNGIVCRGNCTLDHVYWEDVCEDAATNTKDGATMILDHVIALHASDKVFQHNAKGGSRTIVRNSYIADFGKLWRSCGDCTANGGPRHLVIDNVRVEGVKTSIAGANQNYGDTVTITDLFVKGGYDAGDDKPRICTEYTAVTDHDGESTSLYDGTSQWNTATCKVAQSNLERW